jgi:hypothetical protein
MAAIKLLITAKIHITRNVYLKNENNAFPSYDRYNNLPINKSNMTTNIQSGGHYDVK